MYHVMYHALNIKWLLFTLGKFSLGSGRRKDRPKLRAFPDMFAKGAIVWNVQVNLLQLI